MTVDMCSRVFPLRDSLTLLRGHSFTRPCLSALLHRLGPSLLYAFARRGRESGPPAFVSSPVPPPGPPLPLPRSLPCRDDHAGAWRPGSPDCSLGGLPPTSNHDGTARRAHLSSSHVAVSPGGYLRSCPERPAAATLVDHVFGRAMPRAAQADCFVLAPGALRRLRLSSTSFGVPRRGQRRASCWSRRRCFLRTKP